MIATAIMLIATGAGAMSADERVLDAVDRLIQGRYDTVSDIGRTAGLTLKEAGSTELFEVRAGDFGSDSVFSRLEIRKPHNRGEKRGLIILELSAQHCLHPASVDARYGVFDNLEPPLAGSPPNRPVDRTYRRPWGKLSFGFVQTDAGECLSRAVIDCSDKPFATLSRPALTVGMLPTVTSHAGHADATERRATLAGWAMREVAPWWLHPIGAVDAERRFIELNNTQHSISLFRFSAGLVHVEPKPASAAQDAGFAYRTGQYLNYFRSVVPLLRSDFHATVCMSMDDQIPEGIGLPLFGFQKTRGSNYLMLPDLDFLIHDFYETSFDPFPYLEKRARAVFVGATTGAIITPAIARGLAAPRLRAAAYFVDNPRVEFRLPRIVQCTEPEAEALLAEQPFCKKPTMQWDEQLQNRFVISMDGNGATCSRVAIILASHSVLLKYDSPFQLYYFGGMQPWVHYVPISEDADVEKILDLEASDARRFEQIALAGSRFAANYLNRESALWYTAALLEGYAESFGAKSCTAAN